MLENSRQNILMAAFCLYAVSTLISMAVMSVGCAVLLIVLLWAVGGPQALCRDIVEGWKSSGWFRWTVGLSMALVISCVASLVAAKIWPLSYGGKSSEVHVLKDSLKLWYLFWPPILWAGLTRLTLDRRMKVLTAWLIACAILGVIACIQHFTGWPRPQGIPGTEAHMRYHASLFLGHHLSVASVMIFPTFAALDFWRRTKSWIWGATGLLGLMTLFLTYSRTAWVAVPLALLIWMAMNLPKKVVAAALIAMAVGGAAISRTSFVQNRFTNWTFHYGYLQRSDLWEANFDMLRNRPILGVGWKHNQELSGYYLMLKYPGESVFSGHAHNNFIDMLGGTGIVGALVWVAWSVLAFAMAWAAWRKKASLPDIFASGLFCAWIAFQVNGLTQVNFWEAKVTHQVMWMMAWSLFWLVPARQQQSSQTPVSP